MFTTFLPPDEPIVAMIEHKGVLYLATTKHLFKKTDDGMKLVGFHLEGYGPDGMGGTVVPSMGRI